MKSILLLSSLAILLGSCSKQETTEVSPAETKSITAVEICPVSGEKLGSMGDPYVYVHEGRQIKFCCDNCLPKFKKDPEKYLSKLEKP